MSGLDIEVIQSRHDQLTQDINKLQDLITDLEKRKTETIAQLNAFQSRNNSVKCFFKSLIMRTNAGDMGELPPVDPFETEE